MHKRIISGAIGIALFAAILFLDNLGSTRFVFNGVISILSVISIYEIFSATRYIEHKPLMIVSCIFAALVPFFRDPYFNVSSKVACLFYLIVLFSLMVKDHKKLRLEQIGTVFMLCTLIPFAFSTLVYLRDMCSWKRDGFFLVVFAVVAAWAADIGAYFTGRFFGKHKLSPDISPNKTIEGFIGGLVFNVIACLATALIYQQIDGNVRINLVFAGLMGVLGAFAGTLGDLSASFIKRSCNIKDFGNIMPGHGGVLDRFDSVMLVAPLFYVMLDVFQPYWPMIVR